MDDDQILLYALDRMFDYGNKKVVAELAEAKYEMEIQARKDAATLAHERALERKETDAAIRIATNDYENNLTQLDEAYKVAEGLGLIEEEYFKSIAESKFGTEGGQEILKGVTEFGRENLKTTMNEVTETEEVLNQLSIADEKNTQMINLLNYIVEDAQPSIDLANEIRLDAEADFQITNKELSEDVLLSIFKKEFVTETDLLSDDGSLTPIWNAKYQALLNSLPLDPDERLKINKDLFPMLKSNLEAYNAEVEAQKETYDDLIDNANAGYISFKQGIHDYAMFSLDEFPEMTKSFLDSQSYFDPAIHDFKEYKVKGDFDKFTNPDFLLKLEGRLEQAIGTLAGQGASSKWDTNIMNFLKNNDIEGLIDYATIPLNDPDRDSGEFSGINEGYSGGMRTGAGIAKNEAKKNPELNYEDIKDDYYNSFYSIDLIHGKDKRNKPEVLSAYSALVAYADLYRVIQDVQLFTDVVKDTQKSEGYTLSDGRTVSGPEAAKVLQQQMGLKYSERLDGVTSEFLQEFADDWQKLERERFTSIGAKVGEELNSLDIISLTQGVDLSSVQGIDPSLDDSLSALADSTIVASPDIQLIMDQNKD